MSRIETVSRWTRRFRFFSMLATGVVVALAYSLYRPALAQENAAKEAQSGDAAASAKGPITADEIKKKLEADLAEPSSDKPDKKAPAGAASNGEAATLDIVKDIHWLSPHMWAVYAIAVVSLISLTFAAERALALRRSKVLPYELAAGLKALAARKGDFDLQHARRLCLQNPSSAASVIKAMLAKAGRPVAEIETVLKDACEREASRLFGNVRWQNLAFNVAPMFGLAGTVHGMIIAFYVTAHMPLGKNKMESLATGIYAALVCTFAGLAVAIPAGIFSHYFEGRILKFFQQIEDLAHSLMPNLERLEGRVVQPNQDSRGKDRIEDRLQVKLNDDDLADDDEPSPTILPKKK